MSNWVNLDADFGAPILRLLVNLREVAYRRDVDRLEDYLSLKVALIDKPMVVEYIESFIERRRPDLKGLSLIGISRSPGGLQLCLDIVHPSVKRVPMGEAPPEQRLESCWTCGEPIDARSQIWLRTEGEVCSEACVTASRKRGTITAKEIEDSSVDLPAYTAKSVDR